MIVPYSWLKEYLTSLPSPKELSEILLLAGLEVEDIEDITPSFHGIKTGKVLSLDKHPSKSDLYVVLVDIGEKDHLQIVCGAKNLFPEAIVPVALPGSTLKKGQILSRDFQGIISQGMLCSREELDLPKDLLPEGETGIAILPASTPIGLDLAEILGLPDALLDVKITYNRPDWFSIYGLAREISVFQGELLPLKEFPAHFSEEDASSYLSLQIDSLELCPLYLATLVFDIKIGESPLWLKSRLWKAGQRPISNVVDATNYVMLEIGQPLHAFDYDKVEGKTIRVRQAKEKIAFETLDGVERSLDAETLLIADAQKPIGIAGVMGGAVSEITPDTSRIVLESAFFSPLSIRQTSRRLGLKTEASQRFERGTNPEKVGTGSDRATKLISYLSGGKVLKDTLRAGKNFRPRKINLRPERVNKILGTTYSPEKITSDLNKLYFKVLDTSEDLLIEVPLWRTDIFEEIDLIEDIARLNGYDLLPMTLFKGEPRMGREPLWRMRWREFKKKLLGFGLQEVLTSPLVPPSFNEFSFLEGPREQVHLLNPISQERSTLRQSLIPSLLTVLDQNRRAGEESRGFFELGKIYLSKGKDELPEEKRIIGLLLPEGKEENWKGEEREIDFYFLKGLIDALLSPYHPHFQRANSPSFHPGRSALIFIGEQGLGLFGELSYRVLRKWDLKGRVLAAEIYLDPLLPLKEGIFLPFSRFPAIKRDIACVLPLDVPYSSLEDIIKREGGELLEELVFFDYYCGPNLPANSKSLAFSLTLRHPQRTLTEEEAEVVIQKIDRALQEVGGSLRRGG